MTLLMTLRRQAWSEQAQQFSQADAMEQRITSLYVAAAEQLGSDKAAVRLAGLYALARLGQDNPKLRQTVVDVICAYLRMPYTPPVEVLRRNAMKSPHHVAADADVPEPDEQPARREELQVRLTAQRLLANHLRLAEGDEPEPATFWRGPAGERMRLDLVGAALVDFDLSHSASEGSDLGEAQFHGYANLLGAQFHGNADLGGAQFHGEADLGTAQFHGEADLVGAQFHGEADLGTAQFHGYADLVGAQFHGDADLGGAQFHGRANLGRAQFHERADLARAQFHGYTYLAGAQFYEYAYLAGAQFQGDADLVGAQFHGYANLGGAQFHRRANLGDAQFHRYADLVGAQFHGDADLIGAHFDRGADMSEARAVPGVRLPSGWGFGDDAGTPGGLRAVVRGSDGVTSTDDQRWSAGSDADPDPGDTSG
ncbi:pentapeptide repeat-containing protein [Micromonospora saelicesensis]|uniref:pentapeptide repeat-containing protein n=1 Tax=Micromonospora saelicesensis TaxID=285676 RepID=UPI003D8EECDB